MSRAKPVEAVIGRNAYTLLVANAPAWLAEHRQTTIAITHNIGALLLLLLLLLFNTLELWYDCCRIQ